MKIFLAALVVLATAAVALAQQKAPPQGRIEKRAEQQKAAPEPVAPDQEMGKRFRIGADGLAAPKAKAGVSNGPLTVPFDGQAPKVPAGFSATLFAKLDHPRRLFVLPNGDVIVAEQKIGHLTLLRDNDGEEAEWVERYAEGFNAPYGLAWRDDDILVADQDGIWKVPHKLGHVRTGHGARRSRRMCPARSVNRLRISTPKRS